MKKLFMPILALCLFTFFLQSCKDECDDCAANESCFNGKCVINSSSDNVVIEGFISSDTEWTADNIYELRGRVVVKSGAKLTIKPGTIIKGQDGSGTSASVLIVERGGEIDAVGTASQPIIFTSVLDNIQKGELSGSNFDETVNELWGGVIILGNAPVSTEDGDTEGQIEGIPANETYGVYGGSDVNDNSGKFEYVSIRHGGITIGDGNEINGLTLGGVGRGTSIKFVEVVGNLDDGVEFFGGSVDASNILVVYQGDDGLDIDQNYSGTIDNAIVLTGNGVGTDEALEIDGPENSTHSTGLFTIRNSTFINEGTDGSAGDFKSKAQGTVENCVFQGYTSGIKIRASYADTTSCSSKSDSYSNLLTDGTLVFSNNKFETSNTLASYVNAYTGSCVSCGCLDNTAQDNLDTEISNAGNTAAATVSGGADKSQFNNWTWASINGKL